MTFAEAIADLRAGERDARAQARVLRSVKRAASSKGRRKGRCTNGWRFWRGNPHTYGVGKCDACGMKKACGAKSGALVAYICTRPINHDTADGHRQGSEHGANVRWGYPIRDKEWRDLR